MDIVAHVLWAGAGLVAVGDRLARGGTGHAAAGAGKPPALTRKTMAATLVLAALPDILHLLPIIAWWLAGDGTLATVRAYAMAVPGHEPSLPTWVHLLSHHLHCIMHSAIVATTVTLLIWAATGRFWLALLGWWSHIVIDVFTHSATFYPVQVFYPVSDWAFDGLAWNTPWFMVANYMALTVAGIYYYFYSNRPRKH